MWEWVAEFLNTPMPELNAVQWVVFWAMLGLMSAFVWAMSAPRQ